MSAADPPAPVLGMAWLGGVLCIEAASPGGEEGVLGATLRAWHTAAELSGTKRLTQAESARLRRAAHMAAAEALLGCGYAPQALRRAAGPGI